jgi:DNA uptake protein and related DNA-binding proteins
MKHLLITLFILFIFCLKTCYHTVAQSSFIVDKWKEYIDNQQEEISEESVEYLYEELSYLADNPFELNTLTEAQLKRLPFLTDRQISSLINYREKYGKMLSVYELKHVEGLDFQTLELLLPFVYIGDMTVDKRLITVDNLLKYGHNELYMRYDKSFQQKKGYRPVPDSILTQYPNRKYLGEDFYHSIRYSYRFDERIQFGMVAEKDAGEPFMNKIHKGYDYYSFHLLIKDTKWLKTLVIGDYKIAFGQGLTVSHDYSPSRSAILSQAERRNNGFRRHYSTNESDYFRGVGATFTFKGTDLSVFYSDKNMDGSADSLLITSLKTDGLHRLQRDWNKRNQVKMRALGGNLRYATENLAIGLTALHYAFGGKRYEPQLQPYSLYYFRGENNTNLSVDYMFKKGGIKFYGETAVSANKAMAALNGLQIQPVSYASFLLLYRIYSEKYQAFYGNSFAQNSTVQNEEGVYIGMQFTPFPYWKLSAYLDVFRFPWLKYGVDAPSSGKEYMMQIEHNSRKNTFSFRYRYKQTERNRMVDKNNRVGEFDLHRFRFQFTHKTDNWNFRTSLDGVGYSRESSGMNKGWMIGEGISFDPETSKLEADLYIAYFDTDNSSVMLSSFERTPLYVYYKPSFYGQGVRMACSFRYAVSRWVMLTLKLSTTHYIDRDRIGTELEEIEGRDKTDFNLILRWKF